MTRTLLAKPKRLVSAAVVASVTVATLGLTAGAAFAAAPATAITSSTASPVHIAGTSTSLNYSETTTGGGAADSTVRYAVVAGSNVDTAGNGNNAADGTCDVPAAGAGACSVTGLTVAGSSTVTIFADLNGDSIITAGEPTVSITVVKAGPVYTVTLDKHSVGTSSGSAVALVATAKDSLGNIVPGAPLAVTATQNAAAGSNPLSVNSGAALTGSSPNWQADNTVTAGADGTATVNVASSVAGSVLVRVYSDTNTSGSYDAGEANDTATITVVAGGNAGVTTVAITPATDTRYKGDSQTVNITLSGSGGVPISNVVANYVVTGANPSSGTVPMTNSSGKASFTYTATNVGTDSVLVYVNLPSGTTAGRDSGEPGATATRTTVNLPTYTDVIAMCTQQLADQYQGKQININDTEECAQPIDVKSSTFTYKVVNGSTPVAGVVLSLDEYDSGTVGTVTWSAPTCTTDATGICSVTGTASAPTNNGWIEADAYVGTAASKSNRYYTYTYFQTRAAQPATIAPLDQAVTFHGSPSVSAKVADQFGKAVSGATVTFGVTGSNAVSTVTKTTDASGTAAFSYADTSASTTDGRTDQIAVSVNGGSAVNATVHFYANAAAAAATVDVATNSTSPTFNAGTNAAAYSLDPSTSQYVSVKVTNSAGTPLTGKTVTFTLAGGATLAGSTATTGTAVTNGLGVATISVVSTKSGAQTVTATVDGVNGTGTITYGAPGYWTARNIKVTPSSDATTAIEAGDLKNLRFLVTDLYGNPVPNVDVQFSNAGAGFFFGGTNSAFATTNSEGIVSVALTSLPTSYGAATVTATMGQYQSSDCGSGAGSPAGSTAGNCSTTAVVQVSPRPTIGGTSFRTGAGSVSITGVVAPNIAVDLYVGAAKVASTTSNASGVYSFTRTISTTTSFTVKAGGLSSSVFKVTVQFGSILTLSSTVKGKVVAKAAVYPAVASAEVRWYVVRGTSKVYVGHSSTNASGVATFTFAVKSGTTITITNRVLAFNGRAASTYSRAKSIKSK